METGRTERVWLMGIGHSRIEEITSHVIYAQKDKYIWKQLYILK